MISLIPINRSLLIFCCIILINSCTNSEVSPSDSEITHSQDVVNNQNKEKSLESNEFTEYYDSGEVKYKGNVIDGVKEGQHTWFYKNGNIEILADYTSDSLNGMHKKFYESGELMTITLFNMNNKTDSSITYYENGDLLRKVWYINYQGGSLANTWKVFNSDGTLNVVESNFHDIHGLKSSYIFNEKDEIEVLLTAPKFNSEMSIFMGSFDSVFSDFTDNIEKEIRCSEFKSRIIVPTNIVGVNHFRFVIIDYEVVQDTIMESKPIFVDLEYFVEG